MTTFVLYKDIKCYIVMKKIIIAVYLCMASVSWAFAGDKIPASAVPSKISTYVKTNYPKASAISWEFEEDENLYEAEFKITGLEYKLKITPEGVLLYSKEDIRISDIPPAVKKAALRQYQNYKIIGANKLFQKGKFIYDIALKGENASGFTRHRHVRFDVNGKVVSGISDRD